jgi:hypothetical protein
MRKETAMMNKTITGGVRFGLAGGLAFGALTGLGLAESTPVQAATDGKLVSGLACKQQTGSPGEINYSNAGYVFNNSSGASDLMTVLCPLVADQNGSIDLSDTDVRFYDGHDGEVLPDSVSCWLRGKDNVGGALWTSDCGSSFGWTGGGYFTFNCVGSDPGYTITDLDQFFLECDIPEKDDGVRSRLYGIFYEEVN